MREDLKKQLTEAAKAGNIPDSLIREIFDDCAKKIGVVINPLDPISAPFLLAALENYAEAIRQAYPDAERVSGELSRSIGSACVLMPWKVGTGS